MNDIYINHIQEVFIDLAIKVYQRFHHLIRNNKIALALNITPFAFTKWISQQLLSNVFVITANCGTMKNTLFAKMAESDESHELEENNLKVECNLQ